MNADHPSHEQLTAFQWGKLEPDEQEAVASHVDSCEVCCEALREIPDATMISELRGVTEIAEDDPLPPELRDHSRYKIGKFLGAGGMGLVYQAEHRLMDRVVALKIIHRELSGNPKVLRRFHQEVKAAARLLHPNIVTAYDAEQAGDIHFLVMEFVDGISLDRIVNRRGAMEIPYAANYMRQTAKGLQHAFEAGMVHRDIKPQNLMVTRKGQVKILDFGLARLASESREDLEGVEGLPALGVTKIGTILGTPDFMAPEQTFDSSQADIRADIYSLGCTFYYLLAGHPPFTGTTKAKIMSQRTQNPVPISKLRDDVSAELAEVLDKMLAKEPGERYQTPAELVQALTQLARPMPAAPEKLAPAAPPPMPTPPAPTPSLISAPTPIEEPKRTSSRRVVVKCPFCLSSVRISRRDLGESLQCPKCSCHFTAAD